MNNELSEETALIHRLKAGDTNAFLLLYDKYHAGLYNYVLNFIKVPALAEDVLQDVFLKLWEIRHQINTDLSFNGYLYRISRNKVFKLIKKLATDKQLRLQVMYELNHAAEGTDLKLQWQEYETILKAAIDHLPPKRQTIFKLCRQDGKKYEEVAAELNISSNTVKEHMVLATRFIKEYFYRHSDVRFGVILVIFSSANLSALFFSRFF